MAYKPRVPNKEFLDFMQQIEEERQQKRSRYQQARDWALGKVSDIDESVFGGRSLAPFLEWLISEDPELATLDLAPVPLPPKAIKALEKLAKKLPKVLPKLTQAGRYNIGSEAIDNPKTASLLARQGVRLPMAKGTPGPDVPRGKRMAMENYELMRKMVEEDPEALIFPFERFLGNDTKRSAARVRLDDLMYGDPQYGTMGRKGSEDFVQPLGPRSDAYDPNPIDLEEDEIIQFLFDLGVDPPKPKY